jgi:hypothetical protein
MFIASTIDFFNFKMFQNFVIPKCFKIVMLANAIAIVTVVTANTIAIADEHMLRIYASYIYKKIYRVYLYYTYAEHMCSFTTDQPRVSGQTKTLFPCAMCPSQNPPGGPEPSPLNHLFIGPRPWVLTILFFCCHRNCSLSSCHRTAPPSASTPDCRVLLHPTRHCRSDTPPRLRSSSRLHPEARRRQILLGATSLNFLHDLDPVSATHLERVDLISHRSPHLRTFSSTLIWYAPPTSSVLTLDPDGHHLPEPPPPRPRSGGVCHPH